MAQAYVNRQRGFVVYAGALIKRLTRDVRDAVTARAGGGKASATPLLYGFNRISVAATPADSVLAPAAVVGAECWITNDGASSIQIFGQGTDTIDAVATATGVPMAAAKRGVLICHSAGAWVSVVGAKSS